MRLLTAIYPKKKEQQEKNHVSTLKSHTNGGTFPYQYRQSENLVYDMEKSPHENSYAGEPSRRNNLQAQKCDHP